MNSFLLKLGCPSPSLPGLNVAMGYVDRPFMKAGSYVVFNIRKNLIKAQVTKMPFVPTQYYIKKKIIRQEILNCSQRLVTMYVM